MENRFKFLFLTIIIITGILFSGCDIKFIEKIPEVETSSDVALPDANDEPSDVQKKTEPITTIQPTTQENLKTTNINGTDFILSNATVFVKEKTNLFDSPSMKNQLGSVNVGTILVSYGVSTDSKINMVKYNGGDYCYIDNSAVTTGYVEVPTEEPPTEPETEEKKQDSSSKAESSKQDTSSSSGETSKSETSSKTSYIPPQSSVVSQSPKPSVQKPATTQAPTVTGGISYPSNVYSTSVNFGVTFADVNKKVKVVKTANMNSGPGKALNSTGYYTMQTFNTGTILTCTGIGKNGYIRVKLANGTIGYIDNTYLVLY